MKLVKTILFKNPNSYIKQIKKVKDLTIAYGPSLAGTISAFYIANSISKNGSCEEGQSKKPSPRKNHFDEFCIQAGGS